MTCSTIYQFEEKTANNNHSSENISFKELPSPHDNSIEGIASCVRFLKESGIRKLFDKIPDTRQQAKVTYPMGSLIMQAFFVPFFRSKSKNGFTTSFQKENPTLLQMLSLHQLPHLSTVDDALDRISPECLNEVMLDYLQNLINKKFFYNHLSLLPGDALTVGFDGFWIHKYEKPHSQDEEGRNICPYCLPRTCNKGTEKEKTYWVHTTVTCSLLCDGMTLPLYCYPLKAEQVKTELNDEQLKQECELEAVKRLLPLLRKKFPRMKILFLGDALYSNRPMWRLLSQENIEGICVLKGNLTKVTNKCDELAQLEHYKKYCSKTEKVFLGKGNGVLRKETHWFNQVDAGEGVLVNVLRYKEALVKEDGSVEMKYQGSWISTKKITGSNCFPIMLTARKRWNHEDMHNTFRNRDFDIEHDMVRSRPNAQMAWKILTFIALFSCTLFEKTQIAQKVRKKRPLKHFVRDLFYQLIHISWIQINNCPWLSKPKVQFRYLFNKEIFT